MAITIAGIDPLWGDGLTYSAKELRQLSISAQHPVVGGAGPIVVASGVYPGSGDTPLKVSPSSGMVISVAAGFAVVQGTGTADQGAYRVGLATAGTIDVPAAHATLARFDLIVAKVIDNGDSTSTGPIALVQGTPAGSPAEPAVPANSTTLARITVGAAVSSINAGNITDRRVFAVPAGGVQPTTSGATVTAPHEGQLRYDTDTDTIRAWDGSAWQQVGARHAPRGIVAYGYNTANSSAWTTSSDVTVQTVSAPMVSGRRYLVVSEAKIGNAGGTNTAGDYVVMRHKVGGTSKSSHPFVTASAVAGLAGNAFTYTTLIDDATTATHTVILTGANISGSGTHQILAATPADRCFIAVMDVGSLV